MREALQKSSLAWALGVALVDTVASSLVSAALQMICVN